MANLNAQLKRAVQEPLEQIRAYLAANPQKPGQTPSPQPGRWVAAKPTAAAANLVDELIEELQQVYDTAESVATIEKLATAARAALALALQLEQRHHFDSLKLATIDAKNYFTDFKSLRNKIEFCSNFYDRLAFYNTVAGQQFLRGVVSQANQWDTEGSVGLKHHLEEFIDPSAVFAIQKWDYMDWAAAKYKANIDPLDRIVEFLLARSINFLSSIDSIDLQKSSLDAVDNVSRFLTVQVKNHVAGDERFGDSAGATGLARPNRMWTFQVKVPSDVADGGGAQGSWAWADKAWMKQAISLPILRVVDSDSMASRGVSSDFTRGTLYTMDGPSTMLCYATSKFHSSLLRGAPVSAAGILVAEKGRVVAIDNRSGHYQPGYRQLLTAVQYLRAHNLFEPDAFVALHLTNDDAIYLSPEDFVAAAQSGMNFRVTAARVYQRARRFNYQLPVVAKYAYLVGPSLSNFPTTAKGNRWDTMLTELYRGTPDLASIVEDCKIVLKDAAAGDRHNGQGSGHAALASTALRKIEAGGAYCELATIVQQLVGATQPGGESHQEGLIQANLRYLEIARKLAALTPATTIV